ncbi:Zinc finger, C2H2 type [Aphelenchoides besseyi]|nr:Zinc finger, C2H2 type [Aphelenchoides besseyi]
MAADGMDNPDESMGSRHEFPPSPTAMSDSTTHVVEDTSTSQRAQNNNTICQSYVPTDESMGFGAAETSNTSDFLSSTFSLLTADSLAAESVHDNWLTFADEQPQEKFYGHDQPTVYYAPEQNYGQPPQYVHENEAITHGQQSSNDSSEPAEKRAKKNSGSSSTARNFQLEYTENFKRFINIPAGTPQRSASSADSGVQSPAESEENDVNCQPISCPACKSVYSSPRSLTGHIGRTEKCRELIGRDYLEEISKMGKSACIPDPAIHGEGISPVCPHCNRFISHYKGNIRRHINACKKTSTRKDSTASTTEPAGSNGSNCSVYEMTATPDDQPCSSIKVDYHHQTHHPQQMHAVHFAHYPDESHALQMPMLPHHLQQQQQHPMPQMHQIHGLPPPHMQMHSTYPPMDYQPIYEPMHQHMIPQQHYEIQYVTAPIETLPPPQQQQPIQQQTEPPKLPRPPKHNGMVSHDDPYLCAWCTFSTVYKGNMKRHLISCHNCNDELLRKYNFELEKLRKTAPQRAGPESLPFIEIKPPQPPGTRRARNPPSSKSMGRPKKSNSTGGEKPTISESQCATQQPMSAPPDYMLEPNMQYNLLPPPPSHQLMVDYNGAPMQFIPNPNLQHPPTATYIIKDCGNDSGLGMSVEEYAEVTSLQALPGY